MTNSKGFLRSTITGAIVVQAFALLLFVIPTHIVFAQDSAGQGNYSGGRHGDGGDIQSDEDSGQHDGDSDSDSDSWHGSDHHDGNHDGGGGHDDWGGGGGGAYVPPAYGSITVCNIILNADGTVATSSVPAGITFSIPGLAPDPDTSLGPISGEFSPYLFTTPLSLSNKIFDASAGDDAQCVTQSGLFADSGGYYYGQEVIGTTTGFATPKYDDEATGLARSAADFSAYSPELFDSDSSNDASRNLNSDGYIQLTPANPNQTLIVLNQLIAPPPAPSDSGGAASTTQSASTTDTGSGDTRGGGSIGTPPAPPAAPPAQVVVSNGAISIPIITGQVLGTSTEAVNVPGCGPLLKTFLGSNRNNDSDEVMKLQTFLNSNLGGNLPVTGVFGPQTQKAVKDFQLKYNFDVLKPWVPFGLPTDHTPTGLVYKTTQREINNLYCASLNLPAPQLP
ncbi:MAG: peptidoglycan-binding domain-containing protein [Minisyncoccia bacterium]